MIRFEEKIVSQWYKYINVLLRFVKSNNASLNNLFYISSNRND